MEIREFTDETERREAVPILRQLCSVVNPEDELEWTADEEYYLFGGFVENELIGIAGVLIKPVLHHARHAWLYDLVVDESKRGYGRYYNLMISHCCVYPIKQAKQHL